MDKTLSKLTAAAVLAAMAACSPNGDTPANSDPIIELDTPPETPAASAIPGYDDTWFIGEFWSGEYPGGFTVQADNVTVMGRAEMKPAAPRDIECALPKGANYTLWNTERSELDALVFMSANPLTGITITKDVSVETYDGDSPITLELKAGEVLQYKHYMAEGFFVATREGIDYEMHEQDLTDSAEFEASDGPDEWVNVKCYDGQDTRAWILLAEVLTQDDIAQTEHDSFGTAHDITPE